MMEGLVAVPVVRFVPARPVVEQVPHRVERGLVARAQPLVLQSRREQESSLAVQAAAPVARARRRAPLELERMPETRHKQEER
jgi:hypothetical protein